MHVAATPLLILILRVSYTLSTGNSLSWRVSKDEDPSHQAELRPRHPHINLEPVEEDWSLSARDQVQNHSAISSRTDRRKCHNKDARFSYSPPPIVVPPLTPFDPLLSTVYRYRHQKSVNLGAWFVAEQWMSPSIFECAHGPQAAELDITSGPNGEPILQKHWDTFITQPDFDYLASIGINTVRLPIGYWSLGPAFCQDTPFQDVSHVYADSWNRVLRTLQMAEDAGIGVLVDLHDGHVGLFENQDNMDKTISVLEFLVGQLAPLNNVVGVQILNEPNDDPKLIPFYSDAITKMRAVSAEAAELPLYIHDAFNLPKYIDFVNNRTDFVVLDHHSYFVFTPSDAAEPASQHTSDINTQVSDELKSNLPRHNVVVGEWSCALTPESLEHEENKDQSVRDFCRTQLDVYTEDTAGWAFWSYKTEDCEQDPAWCFRSAVQTGALPDTFFSYNVSDPSFLTHILGRPLAAPKPSPRAVQDDARSLDLPRALFDSFDNLRDSKSTPGSPEDKGFSDGHKTAKQFATHGLSKLGFVGQYISHLLESKQAGVDPGNEDECKRYEDAFVRGLKHGEEQVAQLIATHDL
ncbi:Glucan 1,3-beta-glucosidase 3 [Marasmius crinis-equi]|uniref:Glucan 1,3-beta-glucosidase 3 n=1 Tax=Marasmius crinis-equi TaxID=585013 RepID=A0ABR3FDC4_9AGAR